MHNHNRNRIYIPTTRILASHPSTLPSIDEPFQLINQLINVPLTIHPIANRTSPPSTNTNR